MKQKFHFQHHKTEALKTRRRFAALNLVLFIAAAVAIGTHYVGSHASTSVTISGRVYNGSTGGGYANVTIFTCNSHPNGLTDGRGYWSVTVASGAIYCARVSSFPYSTTYLSGPVATTAHGGTTSYELNIAGVNCYGSSSCSSGYRSDDRNFANTAADTNTDFTYNDLPRPTPPPTPRPTSAPTPQPTAHPVPTPAPGPGPVQTPSPTRPIYSSIYSRPTSVVTPAPGAAPTPAPVPDTVAPTTPTAFQALAASSSALVQLSWVAATDNVGVASYHLERSVDQSTWGAIGDQSDITFQDTTAAFGVHYYYRVSAFDAAGNQSGFALADATTSAFNGTITTTTQSFTSDDKLATVTIPSGAFDDSADCTVIVSTLTIPVGKSILVAGPYQILCKDSSGNDILTTKQPLLWTYAIKGKMAGYQKPTGVTVTGSGGPDSSTKSTYNTKTGVLNFTSAAVGTTAVLAVTSAGAPITAIIFIILFILIVIGIVVVFLRKGQKRDYNDYIRSKYYDL
jgi:hypothetical protein